MTLLPAVLALVLLLDLVVCVVLLPSLLIRGLLAPLFPAVVFCAPGRQKRLALSIDDGPSGPGSEALLDLLQELQVPATFFLIGSHISALPEASTHVTADPVRSRKLLLHEEEVKKLVGKVEQRLGFGVAVHPVGARCGVDARDHAVGPVTRKGALDTQDFVNAGLRQALGVGQGGGIKHHFAGAGHGGKGDALDRHGIQNQWFKTNGSSPTKHCGR
jgi:hypothetical protein